MCLSAQASFTVAASLGIIGAYALATSKKEYRFLALTPVLFGLQQASEGFVWLGIAQHVSTNILTLATYVFCFFAGVFWPAWSVFIIASLEQNPTRQRIFSIAQQISFIFAGIMLGGMFYFGMHALVVDGHLAYAQQLNDFLFFIFLSFYCLLGVGAFFISSIRSINYFGALWIALCILSLSKFYNTFASMWCFFAAISSAFIVVIIKLLERQE